MLNFGGRGFLETDRALGKSRQDAKIRQSQYHIMQVYSMPPEDHCCSCETFGSLVDSGKLGYMCLLLTYTPMKRVLPLTLDAVVFRPAFLEAHSNALVFLGPILS